MISFVAIAGNAILIKKIGGYDNTKTHGYLMGIATVLGLFGWYVIHTNKDMNNKGVGGSKHLLTVHGKLGAFVMVMYSLIAIGGAVALNPHNGILKTNKTVRYYHKYGGKGNVMLLCCVMYIILLLLLLLLFIIIIIIYYYYHYYYYCYYYFIFIYITITIIINIHNNNTLILNVIVLTFLAWTSCVLGFQTLVKSQMQQALFIIPLLIGGNFILL